ncbi:MAG TPA: M23 family metallopeptidase [Dehalococcoidia bacterium]|nr:M23 family metallopeptidase [Dehalococcoidia bacterium]
MGIGTIHTSQQQSDNYLRPRPLLTTLQGIYLRSANSAPGPAAIPPVEIAAPADLAILSADATPATAPASATPTPEPTPEPRPAFFTYTVQPGDTVAAIAARNGIQPESIFWNNPEVAADPNLLLIGQKIVVPSVDGIIYTVRLGDTLTDVAAFYGIDVQSIVEFAPNGISSPDEISEGLVLVLPGAVPPPPPPPPSRGAAPASPQPAPAEADSSDAGSSSAAAASSGYIWPFVGPISSDFYDPRGGGVHAAIDIDGFGRCGAPVLAAASGTVILVGWDAGGLGNRIVIRHADGSETLYAHLEDMYVGYGQQVAQGEAIGTVGSTGYSTGCHVHFGIYVGGRPVDPLDYLP